MILKASQRSGGRELARHLLNADTNEHVTVHDIRGFVADNLTDALEEAYAISKGTRCKQYLFSLSLNPPETEDVSIEAFEDAIDKIEKKLGLLNRARAVVFHEKNGRRHCHVVWSRINSETMTAVNMSHYKSKLQHVSRTLFLQHGWEMPKGLKKGKDKETSRFNFTLQEWQQAERLGEDPKALKAMFMACWERSDSREAFTRALEEKGYYLAKGDKRGFVAVDFRGKVYSLTRWLDVGSRELKSRIGEIDTLPTVDQAKTYLASRLTEKLQQYLDHSKQRAKNIRAPLVQELRGLIQHHRETRQSFLEKQKIRWKQETILRSNRLSRGVRGIWERITGKYQQIRLENELEAQACLERDRKELHQLVLRQLAERQGLQKTVLFNHQEYLTETNKAKEAVANMIGTGQEPLAPPAHPVQKALSQKITELEVRIISMTGNIAELQSALESDLISDDLRARIRQIIERTAAVFHAKTVEQEKMQAERKQEELERRKAEYDTLIRQYAELQAQQEQQNKQAAVNKEFYALILNMSASLNGIPLYQITIASSMLDEQTYTQSLQQQDNSDLLKTIFRKSKPQKPEEAATHLRENVLQVKEALRRAKTKANGSAKRAPHNARKHKTSEKFNRL